MKQKKLEKLINPQRFADHGLTREETGRAIDFVIARIRENLDTFTHEFPDYGGHLRYKGVVNDGWVASFWTGMLWLAWEHTGDPEFRRVAEIQVENFLDRMVRKVEINTHDLGFLYSLSCVAASRLTGNVTAQRAALMAADHLITRFHSKAGIIQAWGDPQDPEQQGRMIIDCNLNLPLLYWASEHTGNPVYREIAQQHIHQAMQWIVREDASTFHTFFMDVETGAPRHGKTHQGFSDASCWARGQGWGVYGFPLSYRYLREPELLELTRCTAHYFLNRLPEDHVCYWDLIFTGGDEPRDSSAAAIVACGLMELVRHLPVTDPHRRDYEDAAMSMMAGLMRGYTAEGCPGSNAVLLHGVGSKPHGIQVDEPLIYGDYFYFEALIRLYRDWNPYW